MSVSSIINQTTGLILTELVPDEGGGSNWSTFPATVDVNMASFDLLNVGGMQSTSGNIVIATSTGTGGDVAVTGQVDVDVTATTGNVNVVSSAGDVNIGGNSDVSATATTGNVSLNAPAGQCNMTAGTSMTMESTGNGLVRSLGASTLQLQGGDAILTLATAGIGITGTASPVPLNIETQGNITIDSNQSNITLTTTLAPAGVISFEPTSCVAIGGGAVIPAAGAGFINMSGGAPLRTNGGAGGLFSLQKDAGGTVAVTAYLPINIGGTNYWIPLMPSDPQTT